MESTVPNEPEPHLLNVDDEPVILQILKAVFEDEPYRLSLASSGGEALEILRREGVDLLVTDKNLPDVNGLELLRAAKRANQDTEVIIITGYGSLDSALAAMEFDAFDYVLKPLNNVFDIRKKVRRALEKQRLAVQNRILLEHLAARNAALERAIEERRHLQASLVQTEKLAGIGTLAAGVAHEVSSPLYRILGLAEACLEEEDREVVRQHARDILDHGRGIRMVLNDLTGYDRASRGEDLDAVDLAGAIRDAIRLVERSADTRDVLIETQLAERCALKAQATEVQQVFANLVRNAVEAIATSETRKGGRIQVRCGADDGAVWAEVADDGPGIPEDRLVRVFDPFYTTKQPGRGTGLGLNIVYRIVARCRGTIQVRSAVGEGTVFSLRFPAEA